MMEKPYTKAELARIMERFHADKKRGISWEHFSNLAGFPQRYLRDIFVYHRSPISDAVQHRVSKAYRSWLRGEVEIMQNRDQSTFVRYKKEARPVMKRGYGLDLVNGEIKLKIGLKNRRDYTYQSFDDKLNRG